MMDKAVGCILLAIGITYFVVESFFGLCYMLFEQVKNILGVKVE